MNATKLRELDAWIAFHIMDKTTELVRLTEANSWCVPNYTADPAAAMEVLKKCVGKADHMEFDQFPNGDLRVFDWNISERAPTLEIAICLFAKKLFSK